MSKARDLADGTFSGAFSADSPTLVVDATNNAVGVGNAAPQRQFHIGASDNTNHDAVVVLNNGGATGYRAGIEWRYESNTTPRARISVNASDLILRFDTNNTERMAIDSAGRVTMPYQPMCLIRKTTSQSSSGGSDINPVTFGGVRDNVGNHYNTSTNKFTAPISGTYCVSFQIHGLRNSANYISAQVQINGATIGNIAAFQYSQPSWASYDQTFFVTLTANDAVWIKVAQDANASLDNTGHFSVYLVG